MFSSEFSSALSVSMLLPDLPELVSDDLAADIFGDALLPKEPLVQQAGDEVGLYTLVEKIGDGAFGTVWKAEQSLPMKREVALKILKLGMDTLEVMARFEQERQALALMDHPNIAKVLDAGATAEGRPFFVMELVRGVPLNRYVHEKALPVECRLMLMREVCAGVQHAHQKGIIHRDLKPSNILVTEIDGVPVPKIIDFGIAKATTTDKLTEFTLMTRLDQLIGTPLYMSPEQADANSDIDTRSDVYALGALLYEMLTGHPPFDRKTLNAVGYDEMRRIIREVEPRPPSRWKTDLQSRKREGGKGTEVRIPDFGFQVSKDLDLITLKALAKDRTRRYQSATALGEDIQRFLDHEPILARAPSTLYLLQRWGRRHRTASAAVLIVTLTLLGGLLATYLQKLAAEEEEHQADSMLEMVMGVLAESDTLRRGTVKEVQELIGQIARDSAKFPQNNLRHMRLETAIAKAYIGVSDSVEAIPHLERAEATAAAIGAPAKELFNIRLLLLRRLSVNPAFAQKALEYALKLEAAYQETEEIVQVLGWKADALLNLQRTPEAIVTYETMLGHIQYANPPVSAAILVPARQSYGRALRLAGRPEEGLIAAQETARLAEADPNVQPTDLAYALESLGLEYFKANQFSEAIPHFKRCLELRAPLLGYDHALSLSAEDHLIRSTELRGDPLGAQRLRRNQFIVLQESIGILDLKAINRFSRVLDIYRKYGQLVDAEEFITTTLAAHRTSQTDYSPKATFLLHRVLGYYRDNQDWPRAEAVSRALLATLQRHEPKSYIIGPAQAELAHALAKQGRQSEAVTEAKAAMKLFEPYKIQTREVEMKWLPMLNRILQGGGE